MSFFKIAIAVITSFVAALLYNIYDVILGVYYFIKAVLLLGIGSDLSKPVIHLLEILLPSEERENVIGDLLEEYSLFNVKITANIWLYKQILKSAPPLIYKTVKSHLASYFGERVR